MEDNKTSDFSGCINSDNISTAEKVCYSIPEAVYRIGQDLVNKTPLHGDHKGSWQGIPAPVYSEPGIQGVVIQQGEKITNLENTKVDKVTGKMLTSNDFDDVSKNKLDALFTDALFWWINPNSANNSYGDHSLYRDFDGKWYMFDCGHPWDSDYLIAKMRLQGITKLEALFLTHMHNDHNGSAPQIIQEFKPSKVYGRTPNWSLMPPIENTPGWDTKYHYDIMMNIINLMPETEYVELTQANKTIIISGDSRVRAIGLENTDPSLGYNKMSLAFIINSKDKRICISGDIEEEGERNISYVNEKLDIYSMPHKGNSSGGAHSVSFVNKCKPKHVIGQFFNNLYSTVYKIYNLDAYIYYSGSQNTDLKFSIGDIVTCDTMPYTIKCAWSERESKWYYFDNAGALVQEGLVISPYGQWYWFKNWYMRPEGWIDVSGDYYYAIEGGVLVRDNMNWIDNNYYIFADDGRMYRNKKVTYNGVTYNCSSSGIATPLAFLDEETQQEYLEHGASTILDELPDELPEYRPTTYDDPMIRFYRSEGLEI